MSITEKKATRQSYGEALVELGREHGDLVVLDADLAAATKTGLFKKAFPERHIDCGIAEGNMMVVAAGLKIEEDQRLRRFAGILYRSYYRVKRTQSHMALRELLDRWDAPALRLIRLDEICRELCSTTALLTRELGVTLRCETPDGYCPVMGDQRLAETMVLNLLANSLQHTGPGGEIRLTISRRDGSAVIALDDNGGGISGAGMAALFDGPGEPSLSDLAGGAGMGLELAKSIAERLGGSLLLESREDSGTRLRVRLPLYDGEGSTLSLPAPEYAPKGMETVLTELAVVLDSGIYDSRLFD